MIDTRPNDRVGELGRDHHRHSEPPDDDDDGEAGREHRRLQEQLPDPDIDSVEHEVDTVRAGLSAADFEHEDNP